MKIGKKTWVWGGASIALAALLTWALWPEYGSGYSEAQRRNWNGMIALYAESNWQTRSFLLGEMATLASKEAPEWKLDIPKSFGDLPLEGLMIPFLKKLAEEGNGDASLELAFRAEFDNTSADNAEFSFPSLESVYLLETYLPMAVKQGREGADFLCSLFEYRKKGGDDVGVKNVEGYHSFLARMDDGDFALGKVYLYLDPNGNEALSRLSKGLRKKTDGGDASALRNFGYLEILKSYRVHHRFLRSEVHNKWERGNRKSISKISEFRLMIKKRMPSVSSYWEKVEDSLFKWVEGFEEKRLLRRLEEPLDTLREAAVKGDLHAKYLWTQYANAITPFFSKDDWESHFKYVNELVKAGGVYYETWGVNGAISDYGMSSLFPELLFYQRDSCWRMQQKMDSRLIEEYASLFPNALGEEEIKMNVRASTSMHSLAMDWYCNELSKDNQTDENKKAGIQLIEESAKKGDPFAMFYLSRILCDYGEREGDGLRAWELLMKFEKWLRNVHESVLYDNMWHRENSWATSAESSVIFQKMDIVSRHGDMPGMTIKEAFEEFLEEYSRAKGRNRGKQKESLGAQFEKRGFKIPEDKK